MELFALASLAMLAGFVSFTSPCALPLLPGYVSYVSGLSAEADEPGRSLQPRARRRTLTGAWLFVAGSL